MLKIKEILRLKCEAKLSNRKIARALNISHSVVNEYTKEFKLTNKKYEDIISLGDKEILALFKSTRTKEYKYPLPDFAKVHVELRSPIVTLTLLHEEYIEKCPNKQGYGFTWFCNRYKAYAKKINPSMHLTHKAGEKTFIDFSGKTVDIVNLHNATIADAILDRIVHNAYKIEFSGDADSQRKKNAKEAMK